MEITTIDLEFQGVKQVIAAYLVEAEKTCLLVETGPYTCIEGLAAGLARKGKALRDISDVLLTHIHFDHAGAAWKLAKDGAKIHVHPFGEKHLIDPSRLWNSAAQIYGEEGMKMLWGEMQAIDAMQISTWQHLEQRAIGKLTIEALHTPGHAKHHITWGIGPALFTGDVGGVKIGVGPVEPPCPPPDIDLIAWRRSIDIMRHYNEKHGNETRLFLAHFGKSILDTTAHLLELEKKIEDWEKVAQMLLQEETKDFNNQFTSYIENQRLTKPSNETAAYALANPASMSAPGLKRYLKRMIESENQ